MEVSTAYLQILCIHQNTRRNDVDESLKVDIRQHIEADDIMAVSEEAGEEEPKEASQREDEGITPLDARPRLEA
jgi:hypothetical protein